MIHEVIKEKRKSLGLTQDQIAEYLGVSAAAVNKWEKANSYPDITLLPALARLLEVDLNTLLCFKENLSDLEVAHFMNELSKKAQESGFDEAYFFAMDKIREYPNSELLKLGVASILEGTMLMKQGNLDEEKARQIESMFISVSRSSNFEYRNQAISMLISRYNRSKETEKAWELVKSLPNPSSMTNKKVLMANLYRSENKLDEAIKLLEEEILSHATMIQNCMTSLMEYKIEQGNIDYAQDLAIRNKALIHDLELWNLLGYLPELLVAVAMKDIERSLSALNSIFEEAEKPWKLKEGLLYSHIKEKENSKNFYPQFTQSILQQIETEKEYQFLCNDERYHQFIQTLKKD